MAKRKHTSKGFYGSGNRLKGGSVFWLLLTGVIWLLVSPGQLRMEVQDQPEKNPSIYVEMSRILSRFKPGINYHELHALYREKTKLKPFAYNYQYHLTPRFKTNAWTNLGYSQVALDSPQRILVIANTSLYANNSARMGIDRYVQDISQAWNCPVTLVTAEGGRAEDLKTLIQQEYWFGGLDGVVLIGQQPAAWFEVPNDHYWWEGGYGYADWTCDLFLMDLDGLWQDLDGNGKYDTHLKGAGDLEAEIFLGRIDPSTMGYYGDEVALFCQYMEKNHNYWTGKVSPYRLGLVYTDHDWRQYSTAYFRHLFGAEDYDDLKWKDPPENEVEKWDYLNHRVPFAFYSFLQVWTHATFWYHQFYTGGICTEREVWEKHPKAIGYNLIGCHGCDWAAGGGRYFLGGSYIYNNSPSSLVVVGTTKVGGMLEHEPFYESLGKNNCLGKAFVAWFNERLHSRDDPGYVIGWHYGMTVIGDPMVAFREVPGLNAGRDLPHPPSSFSARKEETRSLLMKENIDILKWMQNTANDPQKITGYRLYKVSLADLITLASVEANTFQYFCRPGNSAAHRYAIATVDVYGQESPLVFRVAR